MKKSWKQAPEIPRFLEAAVRKGLKIADSIGVEEANDKTWLTIKFTKKKPVAADAVDPVDGLVAEGPRATDPASVPPPPGSEP